MAARNSEGIALIPPPLAGHPVPLSETDIRLMGIFMPLALDRATDIARNDGRFVHYTSAANGISIIRNSEVWMRNARTMADFMEVDHGIQSLVAFFQEAGNQNAFISAVNKSHEGLAEESIALFDSWLPEIRENSYIVCFSEHSREEDLHGRLSMWRAFGSQPVRVALVFKNRPFLAESHALRAYTSPVAYLASEAFGREFLRVLANINQEVEYLKTVGRDEIKNRIFNMLLFGCAAAKHPAFREEKEWRVIYLPSAYKSEVIKESVETVNGIPQVICKIPLRDIPSGGLVGIEIPKLLDRLIIGPCDVPGPVRDAFALELEKAGVKNARSKIVVSNIPLR